MSSHSAWPVSADFIPQPTQIVTLPAKRRFDDVPGAARARPGIADVHALALEIGDVVNAGIVRARIVTGSGWTENTARSFSNLPLSSNFDVPL